MERKQALDFDPEILNFFDQYVHGLIDRRGFSREWPGSPWAA